MFTATVSALPLRELLCKDTGLPWWLTIAPFYCEKVCSKCGFHLFSIAESLPKDGMLNIEQMMGSSSVVYICARCNRADADSPDFIFDAGKTF